MAEEKVTYKLEYYGPKNTMCWVPYDEFNELVTDSPVIVAETEKINGYTLTDNGARYATGRTVSTGTMQRIINTASSYLKHQNDLVYAHKHNDKENWLDHDYANSAFVLDGEVEAFPGSFMINGTSTNKATNQYGRTGKAINCSTFALLVMLGIDYDNSRYNPLNTDNMIGSAGYSFNIYQEPITQSNYETYYNTARLYQRFKELGLGGPINADYSNVSSGDVVFFTDDATEKGIYHVGIVLSTTGKYVSADDKDTPVLLIAECTSATNCIKFDYYTGFDLENAGAKFIGKPIYQYTPELESEVLFKCDQAELNFRVHNIDWNVQNGEIITLDFDYTPWNTTQYVEIYAIPEGMNQVALMKSCRINALTMINNSEQLGKPQHITFTTALSCQPQADNADNTKEHAAYKIEAIAVNVKNADMKDTITNLKLYRGLPGKEKTHVLRPSTMDALKNGLLSLLPKLVSREYQDKIEVIVRPTATLEGDAITLANMRHVFTVNYRATSNAEYPVRVIATTYSALKKITLIYKGSTWIEKEEDMEV